MTHVELKETVLVGGNPVAAGVYPADQFSTETTQWLTANGFLVPAAAPIADPEPAPTAELPPVDPKSLRRRRVTNAPAPTQ